MIHYQILGVFEPKNVEKLFWQFLVFDWSSNYTNSEERKVWHTPTDYLPHACRCLKILAHEYLRINRPNTFVFVPQMIVQRFTWNISILRKARVDHLRGAIIKGNLGRTFQYYSNFMIILFTCALLLKVSNSRQSIKKGYVGYQNQLNHTCCFYSKPKARIIFQSLQLL